MGRTFQDEDFRVWEAYASSGRWGRPDRAHVVFHCRSDPSRRARYVEVDGDAAEAEKAVRVRSDPELLEMLERSRELV